MEVFSFPSVLRSSVEEVSDKILVSQEFDQELFFFSAGNALRVRQEEVDDCLQYLSAVLNRLCIFSFLLEL
jgi:hypothetical protein